MAKVHLIRTGSVLCKKAQLSATGSYPGRLMKVLATEEWSEWLPIHAWLIESSKGLVLVDTGETARVHDLGYQPHWHPFYRRATRFQVAPDDELGPQLRKLGVEAREIRHVVLTHLHTDHAGGLRHVVGAKTWIHPAELKAASGLQGKLN
jgi:N-acyl homoserine lactone hydrolase